MTQEDIIARLANSTAESLIKDLTHHNLSEDDAIQVLAGLCWVVIRSGCLFDGDIDEACSNLGMLIHEADQDGSDEPPETGRRLH
ncbi:hypothetical protein [Martelella mangrovi]|uniref:Uncharacterized protein n=1 Tax=Martelella mangrovi TaxID=1397477 RepID=A0ABV2IHM5_9HYPH